MRSASSKENSLNQNIQRPPISHSISSAGGSISPHQFADEVTSQEVVMHVKEEENKNRHNIFQDESLRAHLNPSSTLIIEDLMAGQNEWKQIPEIIKLTLLAVKDVLQHQNKTIQELHKKIALNSKNEINAGLSLNANLSEVRQQLKEINTSLDYKISFDDFSLVLKDYALHQDVSFALQQKINSSEVARIIEDSLGEGETLRAIEVVNARVKELSIEIAKSQESGHFQEEIRKDMEYLIVQIDEKANISDVAEALETKANKQSVANALQRKANKTDIEVLIEKKVDNEEINKIMQIIDEKADFKIAQQLSDLLDQKTDREEIAVIISGIENKIEVNQQILNQQQNLVESFIHKQELEQAAFINSNNQAEERVKRGGFSKGNQSNGRRSKQNKEAGDELVEESESQQKLQKTQVIMQGQLNELTQLKQEQTIALGRINSELDKIRVQCSQCQQQIKDKYLQTANDFKQSFEEFQKKQRGELAEQLNKVSEKVDLKIQQFTQSYQDINNQFTSQQSLQSDQVNQIQNSLKSQISQINKQIQLILPLKDELSSTALTINQEIQQKILLLKQEVYQSIQDLHLSINHQIVLKADEKDMNIQLQSKITPQQLDKVSKSVEDNQFLVSSLVEQSQNKIDKSQFNETIQSIKDTFDKLQKDTLLKANIKDVISILDAKASIKDVNNSIRQIHSELDLKSNLEDVERINSQFQIANKQLIDENIIGRWIWKSGQLREGKAVPWEHEIINTLQDNFLFEPNQTSILTVQAGLYQIQIGFFCNQKSQFQLLVNGEPILMINNDQFKNSNRNIFIRENFNYADQANVGISINEFVTLPSKARLSVIYLSGEKAEGFIGLKRL